MVGKSMRITTRADVAKEAGVSETIVSYVMNGNRPVDANKRERVIKAANKLHYQPNQFARALSGKHIKQIIFLVDSPETERFSKILGYLEKTAYQRNTIVSLCTARESEQFIRQIISRRFDGIIISTSKLSEKKIGMFAESGIPTILLMNRDYKINKPGIAKIGTGLKSGCCGAVDYLYSIGKRKIFYVDNKMSTLESGELQDNRILGFIKGMKQKKLNYKSNTLCFSNNNSKLMINNIIHLIKKNEIDSIIARNDKLALYISLNLQKNEIRIPEDLALIGFDNSSLCELTNPSLTSIKMMDNDIAKAAIDLIYKINMNECNNRVMHFPYEIVKRGSTETFSKS